MLRFNQSLPVRSGPTKLFTALLCGIFLLLTEIRHFILALQHSITSPYSMEGKADEVVRYVDKLLFSGSFLVCLGLKETLASLLTSKGFSLNLLSS